jgi:hypothetical protein
MILSLPKLAIGTVTSRALEGLVETNLCIGGVFVFSYQHPPLLQQRLDLTLEEKAILEKALVVREKTSLPFWDAIMLSCFDEPRDFRRLLAEATFHQTHRASMSRITRADVLSGRLTNLALTTLPSDVWSFSSLVETSDARFAHLPLLDFHCPETVRNDRLVATVCERLFRSATLVFVSGESYHAIGLELLDEAALRNFLIRSLFFAPIVDRAYVAHQLLEGACALRLNFSATKPNVPTLKFLIGSSHVVPIQH